MTPSSKRPSPEPSPELGERLMKEFQGLGINNPNSLTEEQRAALQKLIADIMAEPSLSTADRLSMNFLKSSIFPDPQGARVETEIKELFNSIPQPEDPISPMDDKDKQQFQQEEASLNPQIVAILYDSPISPDDLDPMGTKLKALVTFLDAELAKGGYCKDTQYQLYNKRMLAKLIIVESSADLLALVKEYTALAIAKPELRFLVKEILQDYTQCISISDFIENILPAMRNMLLQELSM